MSKRRCTALDTLFTFWPPAPWERIKWSSISVSGILTVLEIFIIQGLSFGSKPMLVAGTLGMLSITRQACM